MTDLDVRSEIEQILLEFGRVTAIPWANKHARGVKYDAEEDGQSYDWTEETLKATQALLTLLDRVRIEARIEELELLDVIDFSPDEPEEVPSQTLEEYILDRLTTLGEQKQ